MAPPLETFSLSATHAPGAPRPGSFVEKATGIFQRMSFACAAVDIARPAEMIEADRTIFLKIPISLNLPFESIDPML